MTNAEREALKRLLAVAAQKEVMKAKYPGNDAIEKEWDEQIDREIDRMIALFGDDRR